MDEADILKTDGTYIYTISNSILSIIRAYPFKNINLVSNIRITGFTPKALFIEGNYLAIFGSSYQSGSFITIIRIYDVSNRANPYQIRGYSIEGNYFNGRKTSDGFVYILATHRLFRRTNPLPWLNFGGSQTFFPFNNVFYYPGQYRNPLFVPIISINLRNPLSNQRGIACLITENAYEIYMSERAIYLSYANYKGSTSTTFIHKIFVKKTWIIPFADA